MTLISTKVLKNVICRERKNKGATFTVKSVKSGTDYTYKLVRKEYRGKWYTHVLVQTHYLKFVYLGSYFNGKLFHKKSVVSSKTAIAIGYILNNVELGRFDFLDSKMELMHTGNCLCCGKPLTDPNSIKIGLGPVCNSNK